MFSVFKGGENAFCRRDAFSDLAVSNGNQIDRQLFIHIARIAAIEKTEPIVDFKQTHTEYTKLWFCTFLFGFKWMGVLIVIGRLGSLMRLVLGDRGGFERSVAPIWTNSALTNKGTDSISIRGMHVGGCCLSRVDNMCILDNKHILELRYCF